MKTLKRMGFINHGSTSGVFGVCDFPIFWPPSFLGTWKWWGFGLGLSGVGLNCGVGLRVELFQVHVGTSCVKRVRLARPDKARCRFFCARHLACRCKALRRTMFCAQRLHRVSSPRLLGQSIEAIV